MNDNKILDILTRTSEYVSGQALAQQLGVSRQAVWKTINPASDWYIFTAVTARARPPAAWA